MPDANEIHTQKFVKSNRIRAVGEGKNVGANFLAAETLALQHEQDRAIQLRLEELGITDKSFSVQMPVGPVSATDSPIPAAISPFSWKRILILAAFVSVIAVFALIWLAISSDANNAQFSPTADPSPARLASNTASSPLVSGVVKTVSATERASFVASETLDNREREVRELVEGWRLAWQQRNIDAYLQYYSPFFAPPNGQTRSNWRKERQRKLSIRSSINLEIKNIRVRPMGNSRVEVTFLQDYTSDAHREKAVTKTLLIERNDEKWLIVGEVQKRK